jgi:hypothetical protein
LESRAGISSLFRNSDRLVSFVGQKIPVQPGWYILLQKIPLAENRFLQAGKGAENTKEKFWQSFLWWFFYSVSRKLIKLMLSMPTQIGKVYILLQPVVSGAVESIPGKQMESRKGPWSLGVF